MLRGIIIFSLIGYVVYRFLKLFSTGTSSSQETNNKHTADPQQTRSSATENKKGKDFNGGEYVDYEEVD